MKQDRITADIFWEEINTPTSPPILLPDIGTFFNQDMNLAGALIHDVVNSGVRYIKGEILHDIDICLESDVGEVYLGENAQPIYENYRDLIARKTVSLEEYGRLFDMLPAENLGLVLSVYDFSGADFAMKVGTCCIKIASTNIVHAPLIQYCAQLDVPLLIDTGKSTLVEIERAVRWAREAGCRRMVIEHSPPAPPAPFSKHNLQALTFLGRNFDCPFGLSDHHSTEEMLYAAVVLGCRILEKGVCPDDMEPDQDVHHALPVGKLASVREKCTNIFHALGTADSAFAVPEKTPAARMGLITAQPVRKGDILSLKTVRFAFPNFGIGVEHWLELEGRRFQQDLPANSPIFREDVTP